ncbi:MAG: peptide chain release factor N(5)-glutamine methyltransferase [Pseudomonadota bacterium]|jgi:release factor glutamine methyltransferase
MNAADALAQARAGGLPRSEALLLLEAASGRPRTWLIANDHSHFPADVEQVWAGLLRQRQAGVPVAYLVGGREFHGLWLEVSADVLDPRPDTETLVDWALELLPDEPGWRVLDLGTGSGAIALAVKHARPRAEVHAVDLSAAALAIARRNGQRLGLKVHWYQGSWWRALDELAPDSAHLPGAALRFDLVLSNPPYIADGDAHLAALVHEPRQALVAGADGLDDLRVIVAGAPRWLKPGGALLLEHGYEQAEAVSRLLRATVPGGAWGESQHRRDLAGHTRCTGARWCNVIDTVC